MLLFVLVVIVCFACFLPLALENRRVIFWWLFAKNYRVKLGKHFPLGNTHGSKESRCMHLKASSWDVFWMQSTCTSTDTYPWPRQHAWRNEPASSSCILGKSWRQCHGAMMGFEFVMGPIYVFLCLPNEVKGCTMKWSLQEVTKLYDCHTLGFKGVRKCELGYGNYNGSGLIQ